MTSIADISPETSVLSASASPDRGTLRHTDGPPLWQRAGKSIALPLASLLVFLGLWQLVAISGVTSETFVPPLGRVWSAFVETSTTHDGVRGYADYLLWEHLYSTLRRVFAGVFLGVIAGVALGVTMGSIPWVRRLLEPWLTFLRALPPLAYFFLLVIWLGIDESPKIALLALAALPPAAVATTAAVAATPVPLVEAARALGASRRGVLRDVVIPAALPETFTGIRLSVGIAYSSVVAAELFNGIPGIGGMVKDASNYNNTPVVLVGIVAIGLSGLIIDGILRAVENRVVPWRGKA